MLAAASIEVMDALFGLVVRNSAEWSAGDSFWDAHAAEIGACAIFGIFPDPENFPFRKVFSGLDARGTIRVQCFLPEKFSYASPSQNGHLPTLSKRLPW